MTKDEALKVIVQVWVNEHQVLLQALDKLREPDQTPDAGTVPPPPPSEPDKPSKPRS